MANIFATGHGLIGGYLARQEQEDKFKRQQQALAEFVSGGDALPAQPLSRQAAPAMTAPIDPQIESMPAHQRNAVVGNYTDTGKKAGFLEYHPQQSAQPALQQPPNSDWINQAVAGLVKKGVPFQQAYQLASQMHQQKNAEYTQQRNNQEFPKLREGLANAIRSNDRASAVSAILQIQQMGGKVPVALIQWAAPNYQSKTNDLGDREVNSAFNPATGQYTVGQSFNKGQSPDSAARNQVAWANHGLSAARLGLDREKFELDKKRGRSDTDTKDLHGWFQKDAFDDAERLDAYTRDPNNPKFQDPEELVKYKRSVARYNNMMNNEHLLPDEEEFLTKKGLTGKAAWEALQYYRGNKARGIINQ